MAQLQLQWHERLPHHASCRLVHYMEHGGDACTLSCTPARRNPLQDTSGKLPKQPSINYTTSGVGQLLRSIIRGQHGPRDNGITSTHGHWPPDAMCDTVGVCHEYGSCRSCLQSAYVKLSHAMACAHTQTQTPATNSLRVPASPPARVPRHAVHTASALTVYEYPSISALPPPRQHL